MTDWFPLDIYVKILSCLKYYHIPKLILINKTFLMYIKANMYDKSKIQYLINSEKIKFKYNLSKNFEIDQNVLKQFVGLNEEDMWFRLKYAESHIGGDCKIFFF